MPSVAPTRERASVSLVTASVRDARFKELPEDGRLPRRMRSIAVLPSLPEVDSTSRRTRTASVATD